MRTVYCTVTVNIHKDNRILLLIYIIYNNNNIYLLKSQIYIEYNTNRGYKWNPQEVIDVYML